MSAPPPRRRSVALLIETSNAYARGLLTGINAWQREHEGWSTFLPEQERGALPPEWIERWGGDGIVARVESPAVAEVLLRSGAPVVDVSSGRFLPEAPCVETDNHAIARAAFDHLTDRGFTSLAFCGVPRFRWSAERRDAFAALAAEADLPCDVYQCEPGGHGEKHSWIRERERLGVWVSELPKPVGVMACYDIQAQFLLDVCREFGVSVPEEAAVIGVDDDWLLCELATPPLSSVIPDARRIGYEAASRLDQLMSERPVDPAPIFFPPLGVATRQSTDVLAIDDEDVAAAVRFIRQRASSGINVADVLRAVPLSRRALEDRFRTILGRTPHEEIARVRLNRVRRLLRETDLPIAEIAARTGYRSAAYLSAAFRKSVGQTPRDYRRGEDD
ncbi:XylR family transcriptional regulator [Alienimonas sp. DA493]|uniref:XylR family transcriptional regulator n=1 Tax=Alienimonas sp. DA493 TaxID=3373605 RepID=UPI0037540026